MRWLHASNEFLSDERGASAAEYAIILAIVVTGIAGAIIVLGNEISGAMLNASQCIDAANSVC